MNVHYIIPNKPFPQNTLIKTMRYNFTSKLAFFQNKNTHCFMRERFGIEILIPLDHYPSPMVLD